MDIINESRVPVNATHASGVALTLDHRAGTDLPALTIAEDSSLDPIVEDCARASAVLDLSTASEAELDRLIYSEEQLALQRERAAEAEAQARWLETPIAGVDEDAARQRRNFLHYCMGGLRQAHDCPRCSFKLLVRMQGGAL